MKKFFCYILLISNTLTCQALTSQSVFSPEQEREIGQVLQEVKTEQHRQEISCDIFSDEILELAKKDPFLFAIVDKTHSLSAEYMPADLVSVEGKTRLRKEALDAFLKMQQAAKEEGINLHIVSGFRDYLTQQKNYSRSVVSRGEEYTNQYIAKPGQSQHQLGTAIDINSLEESFIHTKEYIWLQRNIERFGFSLSFPENQEEKTGYAFEPWHYRYITSEGVCMQKEFFNDSQVDFLNALNACLN